MPSFRTRSAYSSDRGNTKPNPRGRQPRGMTSERLNARLNHRHHACVTDGASLARGVLICWTTGCFCALTRTLPAGCSYIPSTHWQWLGQGTSAHSLRYPEVSRPALVGRSRTTIKGPQPVPAKAVIPGDPLRGILAPQNNVGTTFLGPSQVPDLGAPRHRNQAEGLVKRWLKEGGAPPNKAWRQGKEEHRQWILPTGKRMR